VNDKIKILGFAGSLRKESFNRALLHNTVSLVPDNSTLEIFELNGIPPFNQDTEKDMYEKVRGLNPK
jgi:chromate reductase